MHKHRRRFLLKGVTQGVGFRPTVYRYARGFKLVGFVRNDADGVTVEVEGDPEEIERFSAGLPGAVPRLARIDSIATADVEVVGDTAFEIVHSGRVSGGVPPIPADIAACPECLGEIEDPKNRRYRYPFTTCTLCGPRYTIVEKTPYDRERTSMSRFRMCPDCLREYLDPLDRRFHSETNSCERCGPRLWLSDAAGEELAEGYGAVERAAKELADGGIVAIKGIGGFHLCCSATNIAALEELRARKGRAEKPFAVMVRDAGAAGVFIELRPGDAELLESPVAPIVIARRRPGGPIPPAVAPGNDTLGVFIAYTPLHRLLFDAAEEAGRPFAALVMTSGNFSDEPIAIDNAEAIERLDSIADFFLMHDRGILCRADDSIFRRIVGKAVVMRRARGVVPEGLPVSPSGPDVLALGGELKNTVAVLAGGYLYQSAHIGDLETVEAFDHFKESVVRLQEFCDCRPRILACDMHPEYLSTKHALEVSAAEGFSLVKVQHHHAHIAACMAEHDIGGPVIGVSFDGTGYGPDGTIWGGEFLLADYGGFRRIGMLRQVPMPGGAMAIKEPFRMAAVLLYEAFGSFRDRRLLDILGLTEKEFGAFISIAKSGVSSPLTSSAGRLFDAVSALAGICRVSTFEGQAAVALESAAASAGPVEGPYKIGVTDQSGVIVVDTVEISRQVALDVMRGVDYRDVAVRFHMSMASAVTEVCKAARTAAGTAKAVLSGGVFQNEIFSGMCQDALLSEGFEVFAHGRIPPNDGGISAGQAMVAREVAGCASRYRCVW